MMGLASAPVKRPNRAARLIWPFRRHEPGNRRRWVVSAVRPGKAVPARSRRFHSGSMSDRMVPRSDIAASTRG